MKKVYGISLIAVFAVSPMMAMAAGERSESLTKLSAPASLSTAISTNLATTSYVDGAYKTAADKIDLLIDDTAVTANGNYIDQGKSVSANLSELDTAVKANASAIGDPSKGLIKYVNDNYAAIETLNSAIETLNANASTPGSIDQKIDSAISAVNTASGDLSDLGTTEKGSLVGAINEVDSAVETLGTRTLSFVSSWSDPQVTTVPLSELPLPE